MTETRNYKFRLYPTTNQEVKLQNNLAVCRWVYNKLLEINRNGLPSCFDMCKMLTELKQSESWLYEYDAKMLQMVCYQLDGARKGLKASSENGHSVGSLKFIKYNEYRSFTYNQQGYKLIKHGDTNLLKLSKIGHIEIRMSREIPENHIIKQVIVTKSKSGKWFACVTVDISNSIILSNIPKISFKKSVGIDVGIKSFTYDSNGSQTPNPKILIKSQQKLARTQRRVSRKVKGSNNRKKMILKLQKIHEKIINHRNDFQHKLSTQYSKNNDVIIVENLKVSNMVKNHHLARSISDVSWSSFIEKLEYKCKLLIKVSPHNTTINCSRCGNKVPKTLSVRIHKCNVCNLTLDRDRNASLNILKKGLEIFSLSTNILPTIVEQQKLPQGLWEVLVDFSDLTYKS